MSEKARKKSRVDPIAATMVAAIAIAIACSMMLGAAGTREPETYDNPTAAEIPALAPTQARPITHFVRASLPLHD